MITEFNEKGHPMVFREQATNSRALAGKCLAAIESLRSCHGLAERLGEACFMIALSELKHNWKQRAEAAEAKLVNQDYFGSLVSKARISADKAMVKFPQPNYVLLKVAEEAGEVVQAGVHYAENRMSWGEVEGEIVQLIAMLIRLVTEGDQVNGITPPESCRDFSPAPAADLAELVEDESTLNAGVNALVDCLEDCGDAEQGLRLALRAILRNIEEEK